MKYYVYILKSIESDKFYIGQTQNLQDRIKYHNSGRSNYTKKYIPWVIFAFKEFSSRSAAMKEETKLKNLKSRKRILEAIVKREYESEGVGGSEK